MPDRPGMTPAGESPRRARALQLAAKALHAAIRDDSRRVGDAMTALFAECGTEGLGIALCAWIDTTVARLRKLGYFNAGEGAPVQLAFVNGPTGTVAGDASEVPPAVRWAGRLSAARAARDAETWASLCEALPDDPAEAGEYIWAVLSGAALTIRDTPPARTGPS